MKSQKMKRTTSLLAACAAVSFTAGIASAETWDMPLAYPATNFHSENAAVFAQCVTDATDGELEIVTHPNGSLFAGNDIKRAVQTGQATIGERLISAHANENPLFGVDSVPFLATSFEESHRLWDAASEEMAELLDEQNLTYLYAVAWPPQGLYANKEINSAADLQGVTALHTAARRGYSDVARHLIARGARRDAVDADGRTALDYAEGRMRVLFGTPPVHEPTARVLRELGVPAGTTPPPPRRQ